MSVSYWHFLNTRPSLRAKPLTDALISSGIAVKNMPLLELVCSELFLTEKNFLNNLVNYDVVVCVSPMAAKLGIGYLQAQHIELPTQVQWIAVGDATAKVLRQAGLAPLLPEHSSNEGMLAMPVIQALSDISRVMIWRGEGGRRLLCDDLLARGVCVDSISFYLRQRPINLEQQFHKHKDWANVILISSGEAWQHWTDLCEANRVDLAEYHYVVLGERIYKRVLACIDTQLKQPKTAVNRYNVQPENTLIPRVPQRIILLKDLNPETLLAALQ